MESKPASLVGWVPYLWNQVVFSAPAEGDRRVRWQSLLFVVLLPAFLLYPCRGFYLLEPDEGRYAQIPKEMVDNDAWVVPTLQGEPYLDKPPLMYWLVAISYKLFGISEASARLVPALAVHLTILFVYFIGRRSIGERGAFWAALFLSVAPGYLGVARFLLLDGLLTFCVTASILCGFEAVRTGVLLRRWWIAAAVFSGLGFLTKGPISEILLFPPLLAYGWLKVKSGGTASPCEGETGGRRPPAFRLRSALLFAAIVIAINTPWYVAVYRHQPAFLKHFFWEHNVLRFLKPFDHLEPVWYYLPIFLGGFLPGILLFVPYVRGLLFGGKENAPRSAAGGFWLLAGVWCLFFFSCSGSKLPTYILPAFPPLCLALGEYIARSRWDRRLVTRGIVTVFASLIAFVNYVALPWYAFERSPMRNPELVMKYVNDPNVTVITYPRHIGSVAFYSNRSDLHRVTLKPAETNQMIADSHRRPRTVILFTQSEGLEGFRETLRTAIGSEVRITDTVDLHNRGKGWKDKLSGGPWGLCDIAVLEPPK